MFVCLGVTDFPKIFCETSQKLVSVEAFALAAKYYSVQNLGICIPFEQLLIALQGKEKQKTGRCVCLCMCMYVFRHWEAVYCSCMYVFAMCLI